MSDLKQNNPSQNIAAVDKTSSKGIDAVDFNTPDQPAEGSDSSLDSSITQAPRRALLVRDGAPWWHSQFNLMLSVFALLVAAALLFILLSPAPSATTLLNTTLVTADGESSDQATAIVEDDTEAAPWDESRNKQARTDSQDILAELLTSKKELEVQNVEQWGKQAYDAALAKADEGDELYKLKDFQNAIAAYQQALDQMKGLDDLIPQVLKDLVAHGNRAIDNGKTGLAREKFQAAIALDANNIPALQGIQRATTLDQVLEIVAEASQDEQEFQSSDDIEFLELASQKYAQALELDDKTEEAELGSQRVAKLKNDKQFRDAMSSGFSALFSKQYSSAKAGFSEALKFQPNNNTASSAYRQALASDKRSSLSNLLASGKRLEANEEWASALSTYQAVLQRDPNQVSAKLGKIRSEARKKLDISIKGVLSDTLALSRGTQRRQAEKVLSDAKGIKRRGPILSAQISQIENSLKTVDSTIKTVFESDGLTEITLTKAGSKRIRLGVFNEKNLALKPGRYTLKGVRLGFKDEVREIELRANGDAIQRFSILCDTPVNGSSIVTN